MAGECLPQLMKTSKEAAVFNHIVCESSRRRNIKYTDINDVWRSILMQRHLCRIVARNKKKKEMYLTSKPRNDLSYVIMKG